MSEYSKWMNQAEKDFDTAKYKLTGKLMDYAGEILKWAKENI